MDCKSYLIPKFGDKTNPAMLVKELKIEEFPDLHAWNKIEEISNICSSVIKGNTPHKIAAHQINNLMLWHAILNHTP